MNFFDYFQLALIAIVIFVITFKATYLRITTGINPIVIARSKGAWRIVEFLTLAGLAQWLIEVLLHALHSPFDLFPGSVHLAFLHTQSVQILGSLVAGLGLMIFIAAFFSFGNSWRIGIDKETAGKLVTGGIFSISRNPIYVAVDLLFIGVFLMNGTWFFLIFAVLAILAVHAQTLREERFLMQRYADAYERYRKHTPRYLFW